MRLNAAQHDLAHLPRAQGFLETGGAKATEGQLLHRREVRDGRRHRRHGRTDPLAILLREQHRQPEDCRAFDQSDHVLQQPFAVKHRWQQPLLEVHNHQPGSGSDNSTGLPNRRGNLHER
jgi:hypothetical protein